MLFPFEARPPAQDLVRRVQPGGEWVLRRRTLGDAPPRLELVFNGRLLMDTADGASEAALAEAGLRRCAGLGPLQVLVAGLGFGFTLGAALRDPRVAGVEVVELEPALADVLAAPEIRTHLATFDPADPRLRFTFGDVADRLRAPADPVDCILLDVDNGPEALSAAANGALYTERGLAACRRALRPGGALAVWSSEPSPRCLAALRAVFGEAEEDRVPVVRDGRRIEYRILSARAP